MFHNFTITKILSIIYVVKLCGFKIICRFFNQRINLYIYHKSRASLLVFWKFLSKIKPAEVVGMYIVPLSNLPAIQGDSKVETPTQNGGIPFREVMQKAVQSLQESQQLAAQDAYELAQGNSADLHTIMIHSAMETAAVEATVQLTSRAVSAYKEIMQMQI